ncbi:PAS domain-containing protein [Bradyrhizobium sp. 1(2017)]|uniref:PAS domain-containing protein n=1 Tax=Bradyrhizobium sp. 1(2017) TaxID=1404888 RepID=UPI00140F3903|nr:PAS domain-containing protein [Bradyrhizobium sp. 1(2017)]QIO36425.1 PAS domain-containing protein [Bradyrhizobium sp. 1(2017)]
MTTLQPNFRSPDALMMEAQNAWRRLFEYSPVPVLLLTPDLKIVNANESYLHEVMRSREALAGLQMFEAFPDNPYAALADGVNKLGASFEKALHEGRGQTMALQRYDIQPEGRPWQVRYWHPKNWPVFDDNGSIIALVHHVTDATAAVLSSRDGSHAPVLLKPHPLNDPLQRADMAILQARMLVRETQEALARSRASVEELVAPTRRKY